MCQDEPVTNEVPFLVISLSAYYLQQTDKNTIKLKNHLDLPIKQKSNRKSNKHIIIHNKDIMHVIKDVKKQSWQRKNENAHTFVSGHEHLQQCALMSARLAWIHRRPQHRRGLVRQVIRPGNRSIFARDQECQQLLARWCCMLPERERNLLLDLPSPFLLRASGDEEDQGQASL